jgi:hypothetical protein
VLPAPLLNVLATSESGGCLCYKSLHRAVRRLTALAGRCLGVVTHGSVRSLFPHLQLGGTSITPAVQSVARPYTDSFAGYKLF